MEDRFSGPWYDLLSISQEDKDRIASLHRENERTLLWAIGLGVAWSLTLILFIGVLYNLPK